MGGIKPESGHFDTDHHIERKKARRGYRDFGPAV
jgi:hypothetical protein